MRAEVAVDVSAGVDELDGVLDGVTDELAVPDAVDVGDTPAGREADADAVALGEGEDVPVAVWVGVHGMATTLFSRTEDGIPFAPLCPAVYPSQVHVKAGSTYELPPPPLPPEPAPDTTDVFADPAPPAQ